MLGIPVHAGCKTRVKTRETHGDERRAEKNWLSGRVRCKLLYNESIKSLSLIRNSSHVRARMERGG